MPRKPNYSKRTSKCPVTTTASADGIETRTQQSVIRGTSPRFWNSTCRNGRLKLGMKATATAGTTTPAKEWRDGRIIHTERSPLMGANDKVEATFHGFIPTTADVRALYVLATPPHRTSIAGGKAEFDHWLEQVKAEAKAEALEEAATELNRLDTDVEMYDENLRATPVEWWLRKRAEQIRAES